MAQVCQFFQRGGCSFGADCRFLHDIATNSTNSDVIDTVETLANQPKPKSRICQFYLKGNCRNGSSCRYVHSDPIMSANPAETTLAIVRSEPKSRPRAVPKPVPKPNPVQSTDPIERQKQAREFEINQVTKRYASSVLQLNTETILRFQLSPTDPDFPFDLLSLDIKMIIPQGYPTSRSIGFSILNKEIPTTLKKNIEGFVKQKIDRGVGLLDVLKMLDRELENLLIEKRDEMKVTIVKPNTRSGPFSKGDASANGSDGVSKNGVQSDSKREQEVPKESNEETRRAYYGDADDVSSDEEGSTGSSDEGGSLGSDSHSADVGKEKSGSEEEQESEEDNAIPIDQLESLSLQGINTGKVIHNGTQIKLQSLVLTNIAYLKAPSIKMDLSCLRCKHPFEVNLNSSLSHENQVFETCSKCSNAMSVNYRGELIHMSNSRLGYVDLVQCTIAGLGPIEMYITCECGTELKKTEVLGVLGCLCRACHKRMVLSTTVKFLKVTISTSTQPAPAQKKKSKDVSGLIGDGSCEHYKKSKRWFRFPCCSKIFPCDVCHDKQSDHIAEWATRIICGLCKTEQPYTATCQKCKLDIVGARKSRFWEGGKGTRDRTKMSRHDKHKYKGLSKTVSNKAQSAK